MRDAPEDELVKELALIAEIRRTLQRTQIKFQTQQVENRAARPRLEYEWQGKVKSYEIDALNAVLHNGSPTNMFYPSVLRLKPGWVLALLKN